MNVHSLAELAAGHPVTRWLVLGPFVVQTSPQFEREYLYERERILDIDYLADDGGETAVTPKPGRVHRNPGLGPAHLRWNAWVGAELDGERVAGEAIYETVQRNCVIYAATCIEADADTSALLDAQHSGMKAWLNGQLVCNEPYGFPKGVRLTRPGTLVPLKAGSNLLLLKFRPGYIADGIDFQVRDVRLSPLLSERGLPIALGRVRALTRFTGTPEQPRQLIEVTAVNTSRVDIRAAFTCASNAPAAEDTINAVLPPDRITTLRLSLPAMPEGTTVDATVTARLYGRELTTPFQYEAAAAPQGTGVEMVLTSFHFDTTYHEEQRVYAMGAFDIVRQYCRLHRADPQFRSTLSEVDYLKPYFDLFPEDRETLMRAFRENRSNSDAMYNQPHAMNCGGEALIRNFLYGQLFHGRVLGRICHVYAPGDVFGHPNQLSQIARKAGCLGVSWDKYLYNFPPLFQHLALDGTSLPHKRGNWGWSEAADMGLSVIVGDIDQTPPTDWHETLLPKVQQATYRDLFDIVVRQCEESGACLPLTSRDMSLYHAATAVSRVNLKIANRLGENVLLMAERFATLAGLLGAVYPDKALDKAWRQLLCGHHHDSITGTHNELSYIDLMNSYREALELGSDVLDRSLHYLGKAVAPRGEEQSLVVFNPLAWERTDVVRAQIRVGGLKRFAITDPRGRAVPFEVLDAARNRRGGITEAQVAFVAKDMPSLGYRRYQVTSSEKEPRERKTTAGRTSIENNFYRITVDPARGGGLVSLYDKHAKREVLQQGAHVGNELAALQEIADREETQHEFYTTGLKLFSGEVPASVNAIRGPVSETLRVTYRMGELCGVTQDITLTKGVARIDFQTILEDYQGEDHLFCVTFPVDLAGATPVFDERFGAVSRGGSRGYLDFRTHQMAMFSGCAVYAANKWMDYGPSVQLKAGRNAYPVSMVGLITPKASEITGIAEGLQRALIQRGVTCTPWHDRGGPHWGSYQDHMDDDLLYTRFRISLGIHHNNQYSKHLLNAQGAKTVAEFQRQLNEKGFAYLFTSDSELEDLSWGPMPVLVIEATTAKDLANACDRLLSDLRDAAVLRIPGKCDATGWKGVVDDYGVALLNEGTYANSIERNGTLCMMLCHTCRWYGSTSTFPEGYLVPENKNHVFRYALYPHSGDWRKANTQHAAHEFNFPLLAREVKAAAKATLPPEQAFLTVSPANVILAAMKPAGNPVPAFQHRAASNPADGITLRLYDTEGVDSTARITFATGMSDAWLANLLEEESRALPIRENGLDVPVAPFSIETVGFVPNTLGPKAGRRILGAQAEPVQPVWLRSWEHDAESLPMGYGAVTCTLGRDLREEDNGQLLRIKVNAVNDFTDAAIAVTANVAVPKGWQASPATLAFELPALGHNTKEVQITRPEPDTPGQVKLRYEFDGQTFQDVLEIGAAFELTMEAAHEGDTIVVHLTNPTSEDIDAEVALVAPLEAWPARHVGEYSLVSITPRTQGLTVASQSTATLRFKVTRSALSENTRLRSYWAVAKLMSNGRITLARCDQRPERRLMYARKWNSMLIEKARRRREK
ncbi:MAG: glycoside hydrolase family 38 C-terminal domain-containing protein [Candidatus Hydrogenedentales bacterium]|jgi:alpha-mannosidase